MTPQTNTTTKGAAPEQSATLGELFAGAIIRTARREQLRIRLFCPASETERIALSAEMATLEGGAQ